LSPPVIQVLTSFWQFLCRRRMRDMAEERFDHSPRGDTKPNSWTLLDFGTWLCTHSLFTLHLHESGHTNKEMIKYPLSLQEILLDHFLDICSYVVVSRGCGCPYFSSKGEGLLQLGGILWERNSHLSSFWKSCSAVDS